MGTHLREVALKADASALIVIDVQNFCCHPRGAEWRHLSSENFAQDSSSHFWRAMPEAVRSISTLLEAFRKKRMEVVYTTIESLTKNGRDRSLDYKISGFNVPRGSWDGKVLDDVAPAEDEIVLPKTSCSVFLSTNLPYILRNLGVRQVVLVGGLTDQCVESAVRDACDFGFLVTLVTDACYTMSEERHVASLKAVKGFCRQRSTADLLMEISGLQTAPPWQDSGFRADTNEDVADREGSRSSSVG